MWSAKTTLTGLGTLITGEVSNVDSLYTTANHFSEWVTLNPGETAELQISTLFAATGSDIFYRIITTLDPSAEVASTVAFTAGSVPFVASTTQLRPHIVSGCSKFRVEVRKGGTTAGDYTPNVHMKKNGISV